MVKRFYAAAIGFVLACSSVTCFAQNVIPEQTPFDSYIRAADKIFVYDQSLYATYIGPDITHWKVEEPDIERRVRLGVISITPAKRVYVDAVFYPNNSDYEIREVENGQLVGKFSYRSVSEGALLFTGRGVVYEYGPVKRLCWGKKTKKFVYTEGKLIEVQQPYQYLNNTNTKLLKDVKMLFAPEVSSSQVASLTKGTIVDVLSVEIKQQGDIWLLIKSPLGLTGWIQEGLDITNCN